MKTVSYSQAHNAGRLYGELVIAIPALAPSNGAANLLMSSNGTAISLTVPDSLDVALVPPVLAVHDPTPDKSFVDGRPLPPRRARTTDGAVTEIARYSVPVNTEYTAMLTVRGITDDLLNVREVWARVSVGRAGGNVAFIPTRVGAQNATILEDRALGTGGAWTGPTIVVDNAGAARDVVIRVAGAALTTINWLLVGTFETFTPLGA